MVCSPRRSFFFLFFCRGGAGGAIPSGDGRFEGRSEFANPPSLFQAQLVERLGPDAAERVEPLGHESDGATNPAVEEAARHTQAQAEAARQLEGAARDRSEAVRQRDEAARQRDETLRKFTAFSCFSTYIRSGCTRWR